MGSGPIFLPLPANDPGGAIAALVNAAAGNITPRSQNTFNPVEGGAAGNADRPSIGSPTHPFESGHFNTLSVAGRAVDGADLATTVGLFYFPSGSHTFTWNSSTRRRCFVWLRGGSGTRGAAGANVSTPLQSGGERVQAFGARGGRGGADEVRGVIANIANNTVVNISVGVAGTAANSVTSVSFGAAGSLATLAGANGADGLPGRTTLAPRGATYMGTPPQGADADRKILVDSEPGFALLLTH